MPLLLQQFSDHVFQVQRSRARLMVSSVPASGKKLNPNLTALLVNNRNRILVADDELDRPLSHIDRASFHAHDP